MADKHKLHVILSEAIVRGTGGHGAVRPDLTGHVIMPTCGDIAAESDGRYVR